jgi:hypothetical protein
MCSEGQLPNTQSSNARKGKGREREKVMDGGMDVFLVGRRASLASVRGPMTRFLALSIAVFVLAFSACEKHPLPGQQAVTTVPGIDGFGAGHGSEHGKTEDSGKKPPAPEKKEGAAAAGAEKH